eukprot:CAMPEP_0182476362 /NCGR_PEP_ID=MMETSP1319-20130603/28947_1 /TAXON_ID=172717 /ORGANISM="Bolidomonas pacifica, Strain RCC208" /LENGTH=268 /DNA_ID=CAMNT_0024677445 /DNA_START=110 /DNA_END=913 /DNA_ORIENTATION=-
MFPDHAYGPAFSSSKPYARAVVCIGGFGDSPASFSPLIKEISGGTVSGGDTIVLTPSTYGWHKWDHFHSARTLSYKDWVRDCLRELRLANTLSDDVTVVAHSTGVLPVVICLSKLETAGADRLVFTGSNLKPSKSDLSSKRLLLSPVGRLIRFVLPVIPKKLRKGPNGKLRPVDTINEEYHRNGFYLKAFPLNAVVQMWRLQDEVLSLADSSLHTRVKSVYLVNGELDGSVAPLSESEAVMTRIAGQSTSVESYELPGAGHSILFEKE